MKRRNIATVAALLAVAAGISLVLLGGAHSTDPAAAPLPSHSVTASSSASGRSGSTAPTTSTSAPSGSTSSAPATSAPSTQTGLAASSIRIPALGVTAGIGTAAVVNGVLTPPRVPDEVGAWNGSAALSASTGEVTIAGHVNWSGMAPFAFGKLASLHTGDLVYTTDASSAQTAWRVVSVTARPKTQPVDTAAFAGASGPRKLALITCGGAFDPSDHSYDDNIYVYAVPVS